MIITPKKPHRITNYFTRYMNVRKVSAPVRVEPIHCLKCGRKFQTESALHNHMKFYHKELMV